MLHAADLEPLTQRYGREIFARVPRTGPLLFTPGWWDDLLMDWSMADEAVKVQLFRFVDVLPMLHSGADVARHLREYFAQASGHLPGWLRLALRLLPSRGVLGNLLAWVARRSASRLAERFIAGTNIPEAVGAVKRLRRQSLAFTVDLLGEATITEQEADQAQEEYLKLITGLAEEVNTWPANDLIDRDEDGPLPRVNVSVKLSALDSQFDPMDPGGAARVVKQRLRPLLHAARQRHVFVNFDMEQFAVKDLTLQVFREILEEDDFRDWPDAGIAIQAYLRETAHDLEQLRDWAQRRGTPVWIRLVKGAYWDYETIMAQQLGWPVPVWQRKWQSDATYERLSCFLLENRAWLRPAFGSHNIRSVAHAMAAAHALKLPSRSFEIQQLYGMADPLKQTLVSMGQRLRVYTPYGQLLPGMAYLVRRLLENTANESFLRAGFKDNVPEDVLLQSPLDKAGNHREDWFMTSTITTAATRNGAPNSTAPWEDTRLHEEPLTDFHRTDMRQAMEAALRDVAGRLGRDYPPVINSRAVPVTEFLPSLNPSHKAQVVGRFARSTAEQARQAIAAAQAAFPGWRDTDPGKRASFLFTAAKVLQRRRFEMAAWQVYECGKPWREADADVAETIDYCNYYGQEMLRLARPRHRDVAGEENVYFYEPRGVAVVIAPWNFPLAILAGMATAALVTGNTVVMKPAEQSAVIGALLMEVLGEVGLPPGVVNFLPGVGEEVGPVLVDHPDTALIAFTGSRGVGLHINREAAEPRPSQTQVKRVIAEMGGKNAIIIDDDADLDEAVHGTVWSAFGYAGQKCSACSRVLVPEAIYDTFLKRLVAATASLKVAPAEDPGCSLGPVIDGEAQQRILRTVEQAKGQGRLEYAGELGALAGEGFYVAPHIFADVPPGSSLAQEEIFGPVLAVIKVRDLTHALEVANGTPYALTGGLYSRSPETIARVKREFRVGNLYVNRKITGALVDRQPFGGFKMSGIGSKAGGPDYLLQFVLPRTITENTLRRGFAPSTNQD
jgi:RHH-type proline utilization regulon transcriptional repressor/proline dehydrogenase/delta 1-pyrroline-5-carboxylate dehydrogenase